LKKTKFTFKFTIRIKNDGLNLSYLCFFSPIGFGLIDSSGTQSQSVRWSQFKGSLTEIANSYYAAIQLQDFSPIEALIPEETPCKLQIFQRSLFDYLSGKFGDSDLIQVKYISLEFEVVDSFYNLLTEEEKSKSDEVSKIVATLTVQNQKETRDVYVAQAIASLDDLTKMINLVSNRLREWYGIHFPELGEYISDTDQFFRLIQVIGNRSTEWESLNVSENKEKRIREMAEHSLGTSINLEELNPILDLARLGQELSATKKEIEEYIENAVFILMPNVTKLVGPLVSARLLAQAGSLKNLSKMPSSTVQLLGAERALFRHLKTGEKPPKHGYLFQSAYVHQAPYHQRGRIARVIAGKISIASRLDYFLGEEYPNILDDMKKRLEYISKNFAKPPVRKKKAPKRGQRKSDKFRGKSGRKDFKGSRSKEKGRSARRGCDDRKNKDSSRKKGEKKGSSKKRGGKR
jgi:nucleolar protein 56